MLRQTLIKILIITSMSLPLNHVETAHQTQLGEPLLGVIEGVSRSFEHTDLLHGYGLEIRFSIGEFISDDLAITSFMELPKNLTERMILDAQRDGYFIDMSGIVAIDPLDAGNKSSVHSGPLYISGSNLMFTLITVQEGPFVFIGMGFGLGIEPLEIMQSAMELTLGRERGTTLRRGQAHRMDETRDDGLWALLPTTRDLPQGLALIHEFLPIFFAEQSSRTNNSQRPLIGNVVRQINSKPEHS